MTNIVDAKKERYGAAEALGLLEGMKTLRVAKGKKVVDVDLVGDRPDDDALVALLLGPTGNLRAPTVRTGTTLLVGFHADVYGDVFG